MIIEKSEPTLIPEWLRGNGGGATSHQMISSSLHLDDHVATNTSRNKLPAGKNDRRVGRSFVLDRVTSSYFRRNSCSNGVSHSRSQCTFGRSNWDRDGEKETDTQEKEKHLSSDRRRDYSDPVSSFLPSRFEKDLRRSQLMITGKRGEVFPREMPSSPSNTIPSSVLQTGVSAPRNLQRASFERDFPSLGAEERQSCEIMRVSSPGLSSAIQSMPLGASAFTSGATWTSALAEVPAVVTSNEISSVQQVNTPVSVSMASNMMTGLNMAEAVAQGPFRAQTPLQLSGGTQRLEELAIKQSKQLIPVTPSMPKGLMLNSSEKQKAKLGIPQISSPLISDHSPCSAPVTPDLLKLPGVGKLQILKPVRERNGTVPFSKDNLSPTGTSGVRPNTPLAEGSAPSKGPVEKKLTPQAQSRNDFFNLMRKKSVSSRCSTPTDPGIVSFDSDDSGTANSPVMSQDGDSTVLGSSFRDEANKGSDDKYNEIFSKRPMETLNDKVFGSDLNGKDHSSFNTFLSTEEEEAAFLRSLGWEENDGEDEGLTEEEISSFLKDVVEHVRSRSPSKVLQAKKLKFLELLNLRLESISGSASFGSNSPDS